MGRIILSLFLSGVLMGAGPCMGSCSLVLLPYIAGTKGNWKEALKSWVLFSAGRIIAYFILGLACGLFGSSINIFLSKAIWINKLIGGFIFFLGLLIILKTVTAERSCARVCKFFIERDIKSLVTLGILFGFAPCAPFLVLLPFIILVSKNWFLGPVYMFFFALGTFISPLILFSIAAGTFPQAVFRLEKHKKIFNIACGGILMILAVFAVWKIT